MLAPPLPLSLVGEKSEDPQSPSYVPSIFGSTTPTKSRQQLRRYESLKCRRQRKEVSGVTQPSNSDSSAEHRPRDMEFETAQPSTSSAPDVSILEFKTLEHDYRERVYE